MGSKFRLGSVFGKCSISQRNLSRMRPSSAEKEKFDRVASQVPPFLAGGREGSRPTQPPFFVGPLPARDSLGNTAGRVRFNPRHYWIVTGLVRPNSMINRVV